MNTPEALDRVYEAFSTQRKPRTISACPCCIDEAQACTLLSTPLRKITPAQLSSYASSVFLTAGSESDFRYFLPRILEISIHDRSWWPDREIVLRSLALAGWKSWHKGEREALQSLFDSAFDDVIFCEEDQEYEIDSWICGLALAGVDVAPFLQKLEDPAATEALICLFELNAAHLQRNKLGNAFWSENKEAAAQVVEWLESSAIQSIVRDGLK